MRDQVIGGVAERCGGGKGDRTMIGQLPVCSIWPWVLRCAAGAAYMTTCLELQAVRESLSGLVRRAVSEDDTSKQGGGVETF